MLSVSCVSCVTILSLDKLAIAPPRQSYMAGFTVEPKTQSAMNKGSSRIRGNGSQQGPFRRSVAGGAISDSAIPSTSLVKLALLLVWEVQLPERMLL